MILETTFLIDPEVRWRFAQTFRYLKDNGLLIGSNDLWIAATPLVHDLPVITRNICGFSRVPGLELVSYRRPVDPQFHPFGLGVLRRWIAPLTATRPRSTADGSRKSVDRKLAISRAA